MFIFFSVIQHKSRTYVLKVLKHIITYHLKKFEHLKDLIVNSSDFEDVTLELNLTLKVNKLIVLYYYIKISYMMCYFKRILFIYF